MGVPGRIASAAAAGVAPAALAAGWADGPFRPRVREDGGGRRPWPSLTCGVSVAGDAAARASPVTLNGLGIQTELAAPRGEICSGCQGRIIGSKS